MVRHQESVVNVLHILNHETIHNATAVFLDRTRLKRHGDTRTFYNDLLNAISRFIAAWNFFVQTEQSDLDRFDLQRHRFEFDIVLGFCLTHGHPMAHIRQESNLVFRRFQMPFDFNRFDEIRTIESDFNRGEVEFRRRSPPTVSTGIDNIVRVGTRVGNRV